MDESNLNGTQIALIFGATVTVTAVVVGLGLRALRKKFEDAPLFASDSKSIIEIAEEL